MCHRIEGAGKWYGSILCDIDYISWPLVWQNITCLTYFLHQMVWQNITLLDSFFWISDIYKLIFEQKEAEKANQNIEITPKVVEDIYADVFGVERRNRVRGMGTGYKWADVPFIHTENKGISKEVEELRAAVEEQKSVSARALMEVERLRIESARERNEVAEREKQREAELDKIRADQLQMMENMKKMQDLMEMPRT